MVGTVACVAFFFVIPVAIVLWWLAAEVTGLTQRRLRVLADVGPTVAEIAERTGLDREIAISEAEIDGAEGEGDRNGLRRRSDGMFDQRSYLGRDLNVRLAAGRDRLNDALTMKADHLDAIQGRVERWARRKAMVAGARAGIVTFAVVAGAIFGLQPAMALSVGSLNFLVGGADVPTRTLLGTLAIAGACALAVNVAAFTMRKRDLLG